MGYYVVRIDGKMHFDNVVAESEKKAIKIYQLGQEYLKGKNVHSDRCTSKECNFFAKYSGNVYRAKIKTYK